MGRTPSRCTSWLGQDMPQHFRASDPQPPLMASIFDSTAQLDSSWWASCAHHVLVATIDSPPCTTMQPHAPSAPKCKQVQSRGAVGAERFFWGCLAFMEMHCNPMPSIEGTLPLASELGLHKPSLSHGTYDTHKGHVPRAWEAGKG